MPRVHVNIVIDADVYTNIEMIRASGEKLNISQICNDALKTHMDIILPEIKDDTLKGLKDRTQQIRNEMIGNNKELKQLTSLIKEKEKKKEEKIKNRIVVFDSRKQNARM